MTKMIVIVLALAISGCASLRPDYLTAAAVHTSQPGYGEMPPPLGDNGNSAETNFDGIEIGARWERGRAFAESSLTYVAHGHNIAGGPWFATIKGGIRISISDKEAAP
jgi:hypothetical protein